MNRLYKSHVPTTSAQKALLGLSSAVLAFVDPTRANHVARLGESTSIVGLQRMRQTMLESDEGRRILSERPCFKSWADPQRLVASHPEGSLGHSYGLFMLREKLDPLSRSDVRYVDDEVLAYVMKRYREMHDIWHVLLGFETVTVESEIGLKWAEFAATGLPMTAVAALVGPLRISPRQWPVLVRQVAPWVAQNARPLSKLIAVYFEERMEENVVELRRKLGLSEPPWKRT